MVRAYSDESYRFGVIIVTIAPPVALACLAMVIFVFVLISTARQGRQETMLMRAFLKERQLSKSQASRLTGLGPGTVLRCFALFEQRGWIEIAGLEYHGIYFLTTA